MTTTLWINKLSHHALKAINYDSELSKVSRVKYLEASGNPDLILESFSGEGKLCSKSEKAEVHLGDKRTQDGQILLVKAVFLLGELVGRIADSMWINNDLSHFWPSQVSIPRVRNYLERCIEKEINKTVYLATYLLWLQDENEQSLGNNIIMLPTISNTLIRRYNVKNLLMYSKCSSCQYRTIRILS